MRNKSGNYIQSQYRLSHARQVIFTTLQSDQRLGRVSNYRFKTDSSGGFEQLASNSFTTHVQLSEEAEVGASLSESIYTGVGSQSYGSDDAGEHESTSRGVYEIGDDEEEGLFIDISHEANGEDESV